MPKIKDLGIKVIPEQMGPAECGNFTACACTFLTPGPCAGTCVFHTTVTLCFGCTKFITKLPCFTGTVIPCTGGSCGGTEWPWQQGELTVEQVRTLREQMTQQINALDEYAKTVGPKTAEELDAREKQLNDELADLKTRRKNLGK